MSTWTADGYLKCLACRSGETRVTGSLQGLLQSHVLCTEPPSWFFLLSNARCRWGSFAAFFLQGVRVSDCGPLVAAGQRNVTCVVAWVGLRSGHQDISQALALGPFGSGAFFFCLWPLMVCRLRLWSYVDDFALVPEFPRFGGCESCTSDEERPDNTENRLLELFAFLGCSPALQQCNVCARRKLAWSLCRATSRWTLLSCPWSTDPKAIKKTAESKFLPPVGGGFGYGTKFLTFDDQDPSGTSWSSCAAPMRRSSGPW